MGSAAPQTTMALPSGVPVELRRHPARPTPPDLRAWDAADEYLLAELADTAELPDGPVVTVLDAFGALTIGVLHDPRLAGRQVIHWADDHTQMQAARANVADNVGADDAARVTWLPATEQPVAGGVVLVKVPKSTSLLVDLLARLRPWLVTDALVVGGGMTRHVHTSTVDAFAAHIGTTTTSRARKKARLLHAAVDAPAMPPTPPAVYVHDGVTAIGMAGVFSRERLDPGTQVLLDHLAVPDGPLEVVDLGCGNGIVGTVVAQRNPDAAVTFIDSSHLAVASARLTFEGAHPGRDAMFVVGDGLDGHPDGRVDLVVCNPPFHHGHAVQGETARHMVEGAHRVLRPGGRLVVVGNRHLRHDGLLHRVFGRAEVLSGDPRFVVVAATRPT